MENNDKKVICSVYTRGIHREIQSAHEPKRTKHLDLRSFEVRSGRNLS